MHKGSSHATSYRCLKASGDGGAHRDLAGSGKDSVVEICRIMSFGIGHARPCGVRQQLEGVQARCSQTGVGKSGGSVASLRSRRNFSRRKLSSSSANGGSSLANQGRIRVTSRSQNSRGSQSARCRIIGEPAPLGKVSTYKDAWWERALIHFIVSKMGEAIGQTTTEKGYDAFVDTSKRLVKGRSPLQQRVVVMNILTSAVPPWVFKIVRTIFPKVTKFSSEYYALSTAIFFQWLVGPAETTEMEVNGVTQSSCVKIKKCRFLESSNCVGMCVNLCKVPSQDFISTSFGVPLYMKPNFEDMSCEMRYGEHPPPEKEDPAFNQPCYAMLCTTAQQKIVHSAETPRNSRSESPSETCSIV